MKIKQMHFAGDIVFSYSVYMAWVANNSYTLSETWPCGLMAV